MTEVPSSPPTHGQPGALGVRGVVAREEPTRQGQATARRAAEARATVPDVTLEADVELTAALALRDRLAGQTAPGEPVPALRDLVVRASALALRALPAANAAWRDGRYERYERVNVGVTLDVGDALVTPTIVDADTKSPAAIARELQGLERRVRAGAVTSPELAGATFTVFDLGAFAISRFTALIAPPQAAALALAAAEPRPVVRDGAVVPGVVATLALSCDHRILFGAAAATLLTRIRELLEAPAPLAG